jgi:tetratricopeptide (TPR) repeat protein
MALDVYKRLVLTLDDPRDVLSQHARLSMGRIHFRRGEYDEAQLHWENPMDLPEWDGLAAIRILREEYDEAEEALCKKTDAEGNVRGEWCYRRFCKREDPECYKKPLLLDGATMFIENHRYADAAELLRKVLEAEQNANAKALFRRWLEKLQNEGPASTNPLLFEWLEDVIRSHREP